MTKQQRNQKLKTLISDNLEIFQKAMQDFKSNDFLVNRSESIIRVVDFVKSEGIYSKSTPDIHVMSLLNRKLNSINFLQ